MFELPCMLLLLALPCMFELPMLLLPMFALALPLVWMVTLALLMLTLAALAFAFMFMFAFAFPLALPLPFALSAGEQAVQTLATARRVRSASVLRIEFPPVPRRVRLLGSCAGLSLAFTPRALSLQLVRLDFTLKACPLRPFRQDVSREGAAPQRAIRRGSARLSGRPSYRPAQKNSRRNLTHERPELHHFFRRAGRNEKIAR